MEKRLIGKSLDYGVVGEKIEGCDYSVGDLVCWQDKAGEIGFGIMSYHRSNNAYNPFGWGIDDFRKTSSYKIISVVVPWNLVTNELLKIYNSFLSICEIEPTKMTKEEIELELGYEIEIID